MHYDIPVFLLRCALAVLLVCTTWLLPAAITPAAATERCFGAAGQGCGGWTIGEMPRVAFCGNIFYGLNIVCAVSGGSMTHDPCCATSPNGKMCGGRPENAQCTPSWNRAVRRATWGYQWFRFVDPTRVNGTGIVERPRYCAVAGSGIHKNDDEYCCSGGSRGGNHWERIGRPSLKVCT